MATETFEIEVEVHQINGTPLPNPGEEDLLYAIQDGDDYTFKWWDGTQYILGVGPRPHPRPHK